jgi:hypothetical protein
LKIYDISGKELYRDSINSALTAHQPQLSSGIYIATLEMDGRVVHTEKMVF